MKLARTPAVFGAICNGVTVTLADGVVTRTVLLRPGRNAIVLSARDAAGHSASAGVTVTRVGTAPQITLAPATRTMLVEETGTLSLQDDFGVAVTGATWESSDTDIVSLSTDDPPVLTALASGAITTVHPFSRCTLHPAHGRWRMDRIPLGFV